MLVGVVLILAILLWRVLLLRLLPAPFDPFDLPTNRLPLGESNANLIYISALEHMKEGVIPELIKDRWYRESRAAKELRVLGNRALVQYGDRLRNLVLFGRDFLTFSNNSNNNQPRDEPNAKLFRQRLHDLAPWLKGDHTQPGWPMDQFPSLAQEPDSKALVVCAGDKQRKYLDALLHTLRVVHQSNIKLYITFRGNSDLSPKSKQDLQAKYGTHNDLKFIDLTQLFDLDTAKLNGWNLRIFGLLAIPEAQVALLDVDVLLLGPPEHLFRLQGFQDHGALFFHDRTTPDLLWSPKELLLRLQPQPSQTARDALTNGELHFNEHIQESGVVLIDKSRRMLGLWAACLLVGRWDIRRFAQRELVYGDKELYWTAFETINEPYSFSNYYPGVIGGVLTSFKDTGLAVSNVAKLQEMTNGGQDMALCGRLLHLDDNGLPLWSNGGYLTKEDDKETEESISQNGLHPILFIDGGNSRTEHGPVGKIGLNQYWKYNEKMGVTCLYPNARKIQQVPPELVQKATDAVNYYLHL